MENIIAPIADAYYRTALTAAEDGKMDVNAAHEVLDMARLYLAVDPTLTPDLLCALLGCHADHAWISRYACTSDPDFAKAEAKLGKWLYRQLNY